MQNQLDPGSKMIAVQEFRHMAQKHTELVADFIRRLEQSFRRAYGREQITMETRDALLQGQLQEGLRYTIVMAPSVSGARTYQELCIAAKNEELRQLALSQRQLYRQEQVSVYKKSRRPGSMPNSRPIQGTRRTLTEQRPREAKRCYICNSLDHLAKQCRASKTESNGDGKQRNNQYKPAAAKKVETNSSDVPEAKDQDAESNLMDLLYSSDSDSGNVNAVRVQDEGSKPRCARMLVQGVPAYGIVDTAADITIIGGKLFKKVASVARLKKKNLKPADKIPRAYDQRPFSLDGRMELVLTFGEKEISTQVYIKVDAADQLLLSEGVSRLLGIVQYHPDVQVWRGGHKNKKSATKTDRTNVPSVRVDLVRSIRVLPHQSVVVPIQAIGMEGSCDMCLLEPNCSEIVQVEGSFVNWGSNGRTQAVLTNLTGFTQTLQAGVQVGTVSQCEEVSPGKANLQVEKVRVNQVLSQERTDDRKKKLRMLIGEANHGVKSSEKEELYALLSEYHEVFSLEDNERGETDLVQLTIDTGDAPPQRQSARRVPFAAQQELAQLLETMQQSQVIQPSESPWASPIVLVRKKDGSLRLCVDYRALNSVTRTDAFPLPRIDDILDRFGEARYFTTLDLKSGYWQVRVHPNSCEKTAFITNEGLYEFRVMPFGLTNAPAVFQRLMGRVLKEVDSKRQFVSVYLDDVLIFSKTIEEHLRHLRLVLSRLREVGLKLNPKKCHFMCDQVTYLGHTIIPQWSETKCRPFSGSQEFSSTQGCQEP